MFCIIIFGLKNFHSRQGTQAPKKTTKLAIKIQASSYLDSTRNQTNNPMFECNHQEINPIYMKNPYRILITNISNIKMSGTNNPFILKIAYIVLCVIGAYCYQIGVTIPPWVFSHFSVFWIMCVYRNLNKDRKISLFGQFVLGFWIRMGWSTCYNLYSTGNIYGDAGLQAYLYVIAETFISCVIYTSIPLPWLITIWQNKYIRWCIFVIDQTITHGYKFIPLFKKQFLSHKYTNPIIPILIMTLKAIFRPISQIISSYFSKNLTNENFRRWLTIAYLNMMRMLILCGINWVWLRQLGENGDQGDLEFFNICYYAFVGYLMNIQTYPKEQY